MSVSSDWYNLDQDNTLGGDNPSILKIPSQKAIKEALDQKQDVLTEGTNISIVDVPAQYIDTRDTATVQTVGSNRWQEVAYLNNKYIAVGNSGYIALSNGGAIWDTPVQVGTNTWRGIDYGNNTYVICGNNGNIAYSSDLTNWSSVSVGNTTLYDVAFGNGYFVTYSSLSKKFYYSSDGATWSEATLDTSTLAQVRGIIYNGSKFVAISNSSSVFVSTNGTNWTTYTTIASKTWNGVIYTNGTFYAVSNDGYISTSTNGETWTTPTQIMSYTIEEIRYGNGVFVAVGGSGYTSTSIDGETWTTPIRIANNSSDWYGLTNNNDMFVAVGDSGNMTYFYVYESEPAKTVINGAEIVSSVSSSSTNTECVGAKCLYDELSNKQDTLISGTNLKTINNTSLLGGGNIDVSGGGGTSTDVQINGTSITSNNVANILTNTAYDSSTNKIATMSDVPDVSNCLTNTATGTGSLIIGGTESDRVGATSVGYTSVVSANNTTAIGYNSQATSQHSITIGRNSKTSGASAIQIGYGTNSTANTLSVGFYNNSSTHYNWQLLDGTTGKIPTARIDTDTTATSGSAKPITSGAVYTVLGDIETLINAL